jgi:PPM family protein phosphatase
MGPHIEIAQRTDPGRDPNKQINEDAASYQLTRLGHLFVVCDGMGGHALGQEASQLALRTILQMVDNAPSGTSPGAALRNAIVHAGRLVYQMGGAGPQAGRPGSTCVAVLVHPGGAEVAHVGDSRAYLIRNGQIWQLTKDHSVVQQMIDLGAVPPDQAKAHPEANKITRALGMKPDTDVELREPALPYETDDILVLATDGLSDLVRAEEIAGIVSHAPSLDAASNELVRNANARGGHDNITVQLARVRQTASGGRPIMAPPAPTLVEHRMPAAPEKTLVDPLPSRNADAPAPTLPHGIAPPEVRPGALPAHHVPAPATTGGGPPLRTHPGVPSRRGCLVLGLGFALVGLILASVLAWWLLRGRH